MSSEDAPALEPDAPSRRLALLIEYDGAGYAGSQLQTNAVTVQSVLEEAIERVTGKRPRVAFAGRTDAGVHARGQIASFLSRSSLDAGVLQRALNAHLPADVVVREAVDATLDFDPRRDAVRRHYRYVIENDATRPALDRDRAWYVAAPLDVAMMACAAERVLGQRDFAAFASRLDSPDASTVRELQRFDVRRRGSTVVCDLVANAFLPHQVRRMVGALVEVGRGKHDAEAYAGLLCGAPASAGPAAPAHGLYLMAVEYATPLFNAALDSDTRLC